MKAKERLTWPSTALISPTLCDLIGLLPWRPQIIALNTAKNDGLPWVVLTAASMSLIYTERGDNIRIISLRKANSREREFYETQQA